MHSWKNIMEIVSKEEELLKINIEQTKFYNINSKNRKYNLAMNLWLIPRRRMYAILKESGINRSMYSTQQNWLGDFRGKKVLDFGCYSGNSISYKMAASADYYCGIDLSEPAVKELKKELNKRGCKNAKVMVVDILSKEFQENDFDIVYAQGVLHHFKYVEVILKKLQTIVKPGGIIVTCDPLNTALTSRIVRNIYHRYRIDKDWEYPFNGKTFVKMREYFDIAKVQGFMGYAKWSIPFAMVNKEFGIRLAKNFHKFDLNFANKIGKDLWRCLQLVMCLRKT
jgi:2-polyprenyl-3-methyl-5-hydroxy-6-metoxy-1,4-benzoquinol methylase